MLHMFICFTRNVFQAGNTHTLFKAATQLVCCLLSDDEQLSVCICVIASSPRLLPSVDTHHLVVMPLPLKVTLE